MFHGPLRVRIVVSCITGLLVAACVNRAPEGTFGAAIAEVGVLDLLKVNSLGWFICARILIVLL